MGEGRKRVKLLIRKVNFVFFSFFQRETENLLKALDEFKLKKGAIITENKEDKIEVSGKRIEFMPLWKWILEYSLRKD